MNRRLAQLRALTRIVLWAEALIQAALWPLAAVIAYLIAALVGLHGFVPELIGIVLLGATLARSVHGFHGPDQKSVDRRIEHDSGFVHRPLAALGDSPALAGPEAATLWGSYRARLDLVIGRAKISPRMPDWTRGDPYGVRPALLFGLVVAMVLAGQDALPRIAQGFALPGFMVAPAPSVQAWITPPAWTGESPRLIDLGRSVRILAGSKLALIITGADNSAPHIAFAGQDIMAQKLGGGSFRAGFSPTRSGEVVVGRFWDRLARWQIELIPVTAPNVSFFGTPHAERGGARLDLAWWIDSPYGVKSLVLAFAPKQMPGVKSEIQALPVRAAGQGRARLDLTASPYAGLEVTGTMRVTNQAGLTSESAPMVFTLPAPILHNATARVLEALRQHLAIAPQQVDAVAAALKAVAAEPPATVTPGTDAAIATFADALAWQSPDAADPLARLWTLVGMAEQGSAYRSGRQLADTARKLDQALRRAIEGAPLGQSELQSLLRSLEQATRSHLGDLARQAKTNQGNAETMSAHSFDLADLQALTQRIADEARAGEQAKAQRDLQKLEAMLQALQNARPMSAAEQARQAAANAAQRALRQLTQGESQLLDQSQRAANQGPNAGQSAGLDQGQPKAASASQLAATQAELQQELQALVGTMEAGSLPGAASLRPSGQAMDRARQQLQQGSAKDAIPAEQAAIRALQKAAQALAAMQASQGTALGPTGQGQQSDGPEGLFGNPAGGTVDLGKDGAASRARVIEQELIERDAEPGLPPLTHHYYHRLLGSP